MLTRNEKRERKKKKVVGCKKLSFGVEGDEVVPTSAHKSAFEIVKSIAVSPGALVLEEHGISGRLARISIIERGGAAVLGFTELNASALAPDPPAVRRRHHHIGRAVGVHVRRAIGDGALVAGAALRGDAQRDVEAVHEAGVVEISAAIAVERELGEGGGRLAAFAVAFHRAAAAVSGLASEAAALLGAAGSSPHSASPLEWGVHLPPLVGFELEAGGGQLGLLGVWLRCWPYRVRALVQEFDSS
ncbi:hypothetical protein ACLOJK_026012 [Asimina triloba]